MGAGTFKLSGCQMPSGEEERQVQMPRYTVHNESNTASWETQQFMNTNDQSYRDLEPQQIHRIHENDKKQSYSRRALDVEYGSFTPLVFTTVTIGGMGKECIRCHSLLAAQIADKKGEHYITRKQFPGCKQGHPLPFLGQP